MIPPFTPVIQPHPVFTSLQRPASEYVNVILQ